MCAIRFFLFGFNCTLYGAYCGLTMNVNTLVLATEV